MDCGVAVLACVQGRETLRRLDATGGYLICSMPELWLALLWFCVH